MKQSETTFRQLSLSFALVALFTFSSAFTPVPDRLLSCDVPEVTLTNKTSSSLTYQWVDADPGLSYVIRYVRLSDNATASIPTSGSTATFTGLTAGTYRVYFKVICEGSETEIVIDDEVIG